MRIYDRTGVPNHFRLQLVPFGQRGRRPRLAGARADLRPFLGSTSSPDRPAVSRHRGARQSSGGGARPATRRLGPASSPDGIGALPVLRPARAAGGARRPFGALYLFPTKASDRTSWWPAGVRRAGRGRPRGRHLRRRHGTWRPSDDPRRRAGRGHQPGHAPRRHPAAPHQVVPALRAAPLHRRRRGAHLSRGLRQPCRKRPAAAPPPLRALRQPPGHRDLLGDHRQSAAAGHVAHGRRPALVDRNGRRPARSASSSSTRRAWMRDQYPRRRAALAGAARWPSARRSTDHRLRRVAPPWS